MKHRTVSNSEFIITNDHLEKTREDDKFISEWRKKHPNHTHIKLYDDDNNLYYSGYSNDDCGDDFAALDWAMYDSGCTYMKYRDKDGEYFML